MDPNSEPEADRQLSELWAARLQASTYVDKVWADEYVLNRQPASSRPARTTDTPTSQTFIDDRLYFCGSETPPDFPGYMAGAVVAANWLTTF